MQSALPREWIWNTFYYSGKQHHEILLSLDDELVKEKLRKLSSASSNGALSPVHSELQFWKKRQFKQDKNAFCESFKEENISKVQKLIYCHFKKWGKIHFCTIRKFKNIVKEIIIKSCICYMHISGAVVDPRSPMPNHARSRSYNSLTSSVRSSQNENHLSPGMRSPVRRDLAVDVSFPGVIDF